MDKITPVGLEVEKGCKILEILDDAGLEVDVALWAFLSDYEDWRLVLSSRKFDAEPKGGYRLYHEALEAAGIEFEETPLTMILRSSDGFIRAVRKKYGKVKRLEGTRIYYQNLGQRYAEQAYLYRA